MNWGLDEWSQHTPKAASLANFILMNKLRVRLFSAKVFSMLALKAMEQIPRSIDSKSPRINSVTIINFPGTVQAPMN
jgi:hypothetical protein